MLSLVYAYCLEWRLEIPGSWMIVSAWNVLAGMMIQMRVFSDLLEVPELVNFHPNLRPRSTKHTHEHTHWTSLNTPPKAPCRHPRVCTLHFITIHLYTHYTNMTQSTYISPTSCCFRLYTQIWNVFSPMLFPVFSISSLPILSLSLFLLGYKPTHPYHKYVGRQTPFLESKTTRGITLEYGNA